METKFDMFLQRCTYQRLCMKKKVNSCQKVGLYVTKAIATTYQLFWFD